uniref:Methyltransferase FkbM domain-containing protein n=1 Tax=viral metagenome TaxID=1070528 RepID=A0A6C0IAS5_9ZZZZ
MIFVNEYGQIIPHQQLEITEQRQADTYINNEHIVLELGARYGTVSCIINKKTSKLVSVEPDERVHAALEYNMVSNGCYFNIIKGVISRTIMNLVAKDSYAGYGTISVKSDSSTIKSFTLEEIEETYSLHFNALVADCEGFLEQFFDKNPKLYCQLKLVIFEKDNCNTCNYDKIINNLRNNNFEQIEDGTHQVWHKLPTKYTEPLQ